MNIHIHTYIHTYILEAEQQYTHMPLSYQGVRAWPGYVRFSKGPVRLDPVPLGSQQMYVRFSTGSVRLDPVPLGCQQIEQQKQC